MSSSQKIEPWDFSTLPTVQPMLDMPPPARCRPGNSINSKSWCPRIWRPVLLLWIQMNLGPHSSSFPGSGKQLAVIAGDCQWCKPIALVPVQILALTVVQMRVSTALQMVYHWPPYSSMCPLALGACPTPQVERGSQSHQPWNTVDCEILPPSKSVMAAGRIQHFIWHFIWHQLPRLDWQSAWDQHWQYGSWQWTQCCPSWHSCIFKAEKGCMGGPYD